MLDSFSCHLPPTASVTLIACEAAQAASESWTHLLHADTQDGALPKDCSPDPLHIQSRPEIVAAISAYGIDNVIINFLGCSSKQFATQATHNIGGKHAYNIYYQLLPGVSLSGYIAPLVHELGHVYQSQHAGSWGELLKTCTLRNELGADFLSGIILSNNLRMTPPMWEQNLELFGDYKLTNVDFHGDPGQRVHAFRVGYFLKHNGNYITLDSAYDRYQKYDLSSFLFAAFGPDAACDI